MPQVSLTEALAALTQAGVLERVTFIALTEGGGCEIEFGATRQAQKTLPEVANSTESDPEPRTFAADLREFLPGCDLPDGAR